MSVFDLSIQQRLRAVHQIIRNEKFSLANTHLTSAEKSALLLSPPQWPPDKPVYSPFAATKDNYSQSKSPPLSKCPPLTALSSSLRQYQVSLPPPYLRPP